jgi:uncharacterized repeat protein (TIGR03803 family)
MTATLTTLASFDSADGRAPYRNLIADAHSDLLGTTSGGGANDHGTVFEIAKTVGGCASTKTPRSGRSMPRRGPPAGGGTTIRGDKEVWSGQYLLIEAAGSRGGCT